MYWPKSANE